MAVELRERTGKTRYRIHKRYLFPDLIVLQIQWSADSYWTGAGVECDEVTIWRDATAEDLINGCS